MYRLMNGYRLHAVLTPQSVLLNLYIIRTVHITVNREVFFGVV